MNLIDTHCHLTHPRLREDLPGVLSRAREAGVTACICAAGDLDESAAASKLSVRAATRLHQDYAGPAVRERTSQSAAAPGIFSTAGVHPHEAKEASGDWLHLLEELTRRERNVAVGEIGLDYHYDFSPRDVQRAVFAQQLDLARRLGKPIVIHTREAFADTMAILRESGVAGGRVVFHSFTEGAGAAGQVLELGAMISFSGIVTFKNTVALREAAAIVPADRILIETDAPYLSPEPVRSVKTNEPANVRHVARLLASLRKVDLEEFAAQTTSNAGRFFGMSF